MRRLYTFFRSSTSYRLRIALALKGLDWEPCYISLPGMEHTTAQRLVEAAHQVCPYSRATHGNIAVETTLV